jgi:preprotein translocase subunit SecB
MTDENLLMKLKIERIVLKDLSFEAPLGQSVFIGEWQPDIDLSLNLHSDRLGQNVWEVVITATVTAKVQAGVAYVIEVQEAGVFNVPSLKGEYLKRALQIEAPGLIFPYLREAVDAVSARGGFPPVNMLPFDFQAQFEEANQSPSSPEDETTPPATD